jgi:N-acetylmuramoyl-L-alanine amidase
MFGFVRACRLAAALAISASITSPALASSEPVAVPAATAATAAPTIAPSAPSVPAPVPSPASTAGLQTRVVEGSLPVASALPVPLVDLVSLVIPSAELDAAELCLATAIYFEARGESLAGQLAVAEVVLNRVASDAYPDDVCAVVTQRAQFSFVRRGRMPRADESSDSWRRAVAVAHVARNGLARLVPENVLWYHADYVSPVWGKRLTEVARIGAHIFYS